jgi:hypothetical protein
MQSIRRGLHHRRGRSRKIVRGCAGATDDVEVRTDLEIMVVGSPRGTCWNGGFGSDDVMMLENRGMSAQGKGRLGKKIENEKYEKDI